MKICTFFVAAISAMTAGNATAQEALELLNVRTSLESDGAGVWDFEGTADAVISVTVRSDAFESVVYLLSIEGDELARDDSGPGTDARLLAVLPETGRYVVGVTAFDDGSGPYEVAVHEMQALPVTVDGSDGDEGDLGSGAVAAGVWEFEGDAGDVVNVAVRSSDFDPVVELLSPGGEQLARDDDSGPGDDARLLAVLPDPGRYVVGVTALDGEPGPYEVAVHKLQALQEVTVGESARGDLGSDAVAAGVWEFTGAAGDVVSVAVGSDDFDPVVELLSSGGEQLARDDDSGPGNDARLLAVLPETGRYVVGVTAFDDRAGPYEMNVRKYESDAGVWEFEGAAGDVVSVAVGSDDFDPVVELLSSGGEQLARDDDSGPGDDARLLAVLPETGRYVVGVTAFDGEPGPYEVAVHEIQPLQVTVGESVRGDLGSGAVAAGAWKFEGAAGDVVSVTVGSGDFDPVVELLSSGGEQLARDDDSGPGTDARLLAVLPDTGQYVVGVTAFDDGSGPYEVAVHKMQALPVTVDGSDGDEGDLGSGAVAAGVWEFEGDAGDVVNVAVRSSDFDPVVELLSPEGEQLARDDDGLGADRRLLAVLPETGRYVVRVTAFDDRSGSYEVNVQVVDVPEHEMNTVSDGVLR